MLALMKGQTILRSVAEGSAFEFTVDEGTTMRTSPAVAGWEGYGLRLVPIREELTPPDGYVLMHDDLGRPLSSLVVEDGEPVQRGLFAVAPPKFPTVEAAMAAMSVWIDAAANRITGDVPQAERDSWEAKKLAGLAYIAGTATDLQKLMIETEAGLTGEAPTDLSQRIVERAARYTVVAAVIAGLRRKTEAALRAAAGPADYAEILYTAQIAAMDEAAKLGYELRP